MYHRNINLIFAFTLFTLLATALFAPLVRAQRQNERPELRNSDQMTSSSCSNN